jgi:hypothetical protein
MKQEIDSVAHDQGIAADGAAKTPGDPVKRGRIQATNTMDSASVGKESWKGDWFRMRSLVEEHFSFPAQHWRVSLFNP